MEITQLQTLLIFMSLIFITFLIGIGIMLTKMENRIIKIEKRAHLKQPNKYTLLWKTGKLDVIEGSTFINAMKQAGYNHIGFSDFIYCWIDGDASNKVKWKSGKWTGILENKAINCKTKSND